MQKPAMVAKMTELAMQTRTHAHTEIRPSTSATTTSAGRAGAGAGARVITSGRAKAQPTHFSKRLSTASVEYLSSAVGGKSSARW